MGRKFSCGLLLFATFSLVSPGDGRATEFMVNSMYDVSDITPGDGLCVAYIVVFAPFVLPFCTLRAAIEETNSLAGDDEIILDSATFTLDIEESEEDTSLTTTLIITDSVTITGAGHGETVIDGGEAERIPG